MRITKQPKYGNKTTTEGEVVLIMSHCRKSLKSQNISFQRSKLCGSLWFPDRHKCITIWGLTSDSSLLLHLDIPHTAPHLGSFNNALQNTPQDDVSCSVLGLCYQQRGGFMMDAGEQIPVLPPRQKDCHYKALPSYELGAPRKLSNGYLWAICLKPGSVREPRLAIIFDSLSLILAWLRVTAALSGDDGNSMFEMRSHSIRNQPSVRQNSPAVWSAATAFLFTCHSFSAFLFLGFRTLLFSITRSSQRNVRVE